MVQLSLSELGVTVCMHVMSADYTIESHSKTLYLVWKMQQSGGSNLIHAYVATLH